jgi:hypothetical protein
MPLFSLASTLVFTLIIGFYGALFFVLDRAEARQQQQENFIYHTTTTLSEARWALTATSSGELVFFAGGFNMTDESDRVDILNISSGVWTTTTLSQPRVDFAATSSQNLVFFGGGRVGSATLSALVDIYNISSGNWSTATLSQPRCCLAATSIGDLVLFGGGYSSTGYSKVIDVYNVSSNTWTNATLSQARYYLAATSVENRLALFAGGYNGSGYSTVIDVYDVTTGSWSTLTPPLSEARGGLTATSLQDLVIFAGGETSSYCGTVSNAMDVYNMTNMTHVTFTLSVARCFPASAAWKDLVLIGGGGNSTQGYDIVDVYNITSNSWFTLNLSQPRGWFASTSSQNKIFFGGGWNRKFNIYKLVDIFEIYPQFSMEPSAESSPLSVPTSTPILASMDRPISFFD